MNGERTTYVEEERAIKQISRGRSNKLTHCIHAALWLLRLLHPHFSECVFAGRRGRRKVKNYVVFCSYFTRERGEGENGKCFESHPQCQCRSDISRANMRLKPDLLTSFFILVIFSFTSLTEAKESKSSGRRGSKKGETERKKY